MTSAIFRTRGARCHYTAPRTRATPLTGSDLSHLKLRNSDISFWKYSDVKNKLGFFSHKYCSLIWVCLKITCSARDVALERQTYPHQRTKIRTHVAAFSAVGGPWIQDALIYITQRRICDSVHSRPWPQHQVKGSRPVSEPNALANAPYQMLLSCRLADTSILLEAWHNKGLHTFQMPIVPSKCEVKDCGI